MTRPEYYFNNSAKLASYLKHFYQNPTPLKIDSSLYFMWAYYAAYFANNIAYPEHLFPAKFIANSYGVKVPKQDGKIVIPNYNQNVQNLISDLALQIDSAPDYQLVIRIRQDKSYQKALLTQSKQINLPDLVKEYASLI